MNGLEKTAASLDKLIGRTHLTEAFSRHMAWRVFGWPRRKSLALSLLSIASVIRSANVPGSECEAMSAPIAVLITSMRRALMSSTFFMGGSIDVVS